VALAAAVFQLVLGEAGQRRQVVEGLRLGLGGGEAGAVGGERRLLLQRQLPGRREVEDERPVGVGQGGELSGQGRRRGDGLDLHGGGLAAGGRGGGRKGDGGGDAPPEEPAAETPRPAGGGRGGPPSREASAGGGPGPRGGHAARRGRPISVPV